MSRALFVLLMVLCGCSQCHKAGPPSTPDSPHSAADGLSPRPTRIGYFTVAKDRQLEVGRRCEDGECRVVVTLLDHGNPVAELKTEHRVDDRRILHRPLEPDDDPRAQRYFTTRQSGQAEDTHGSVGVSVVFHTFRVALGLTGLFLETEAVGEGSGGTPEDELFIADGDQVASIWKTSLDPDVDGDARTKLHHRDLDGDGYDELVYEASYLSRSERKEVWHVQAWHWDKTQRRMIERPIPRYVVYLAESATREEARAKLRELNQARSHGFPDFGEIVVAATDYPQFGKSGFLAVQCTPFKDVADRRYTALQARDASAPAPLRLDSPP